MYKLLKNSGIFLAVLLLMTARPAMAGHDDDDTGRRYDYNNNNNDRGSRQGRIDRYLDVEIWENHGDGEYFVGDNIKFNFRVNQDAFIVIYTIDSRNRVNLLFPSHAGEDNFVRGGTTYHLPSGSDDYDLVVTGPEGSEFIQVLASRERIQIPDWHRNSGIINDWEDAHEFMDYLNNRYFVRYDGQRFAYDRAVIYINEWEPTYFRPVYYPYYPSWTISGNMYLDYAYGSNVYINGIYYGITPLYIPRLYVGWHTISIYDHHGHFWESDIHLTRYNTVILDRTIITTSPGVYSKYKEVRNVGYRYPANHGYPNYDKKIKKIKSYQSTGGTYYGVKKNKNSGNISGYIASKTKKYAHGSTKIKKTGRGWETTEVVTKQRSSKKSTEYTGRYSTSGKKQRNHQGSSSTYKTRTKKTTSSGKSTYSGKSKRSGSSKKIIKNRSGGQRSGKASTSGKVKKSSPKKSSGKSGSVKKSSTKKSSGKSGSVKQSSPKRSSGSSGKSSRSGKSKSSKPHRK